MKKFVVLTLFGLLIMAFSATVYAQKLEFKASGAIDWDTVWETNVPFYFGSVAANQAGHAGLFQTYTTPAFLGTKFPGVAGTKAGALDRPAAYSYSRGLLKFDAIMDKNLSGTIYFEIDALRWGQSTAGNLTQASFRNNLGAWATDQAAVEVKNVYIDFGLPYFGVPVPITLRVGAQPFGVRPNMVVYTDGMGVTAAMQAGPVTIIPMWAKILEGLDYSSDDADMYGLHANVKLGTFTVGGYGLYYNMNTYPLQYMTGFAFITGATTNFSTSASYGLTVAGTQKADFWWLGGYIDGKAGPVNINADFVYDIGKVQQKLPASSLTTINSHMPDVDYRGWAARLKVDFPWEKFNFGATGMYATGANTKQTSTSGLAGSAVANPAYGAAGKISTKMNGYVVPPGSEQSPSSQESIVMYSCFNAAADGGTGIAQTGNYQQVSRGAFGGTWFAKLYASAKVVPWYKVTLQGLYIGDTTQNGNTFGTARVNPNAAATGQVLRNDSTIGWELDLINEIQIYKNLSWFLGFGYMWAGSAMDLYNGASTVAGRNVSIHNPWNLTTRLLYSF